MGVISGCVAIVAAAFLIAETRDKAPQTGTACSVQLIRASNGQRPDSSTPVAEGLKTQIARVFQWQQFWEVNHRRVMLNPGELTRIRLSPECEVEVQPLSSDVRETRIYIKGLLVSRVRQNVRHNTPTINGASLDESGAWFVAVEDESQEPSPTCLKSQ